MRAQQEFDRANALFATGMSSTEVARLLGIPRSTVRDWRLGRGRTRVRSGCEVHSISRLDVRAYSYLLGIYLGDGCISSYPRDVFRLRITLDAIYPGIVTECAKAIEAVAPGKKAAILRRRGERTVEVSAYWKHWPCLIPQHGPGRKHLRPIVIRAWQRRIIAAHPEPFLRGLIHSDGSRIIATERKGDRVRRAPRYAFKNASEDILGLFGEACDLVGVHYTRASRRQIAVYSKYAVARLDEFIGPKR